MANVDNMFIHRACNAIVLILCTRMLVAGATTSCRGNEGDRPLVLPYFTRSPAFAALYYKAFYS